MIEGTGPRYCPSIETKSLNLPTRTAIQVFIEPEGIHTNEMYIGGMSSSLPEDVQYAMYHTVPGLEHVKIVRNAYAIEYDCINHVSCIRPWSSRRFPVCSAAGSSTEAPDMKRLPHRADRRYQCSYENKRKGPTDS